ncbi:hypothetical protein ACH42_17270 [Endozoicomonas sp. (ex Bugula neritina AB1)]|nr:hypothetical protein ACH42_17270 [Endozoicomonas sp. (ex Bugula neritina AB1)]
MKVIIGIDPGITGAFSVISADDKRLLEVMDLPTLKENKKERIYGYGLVKMLRKWSTGSNNIQMVYLEFVHSMPKQGVVSMFSMGRSFGAIETAIGALGVPVTYISPVKWKRRARLIKAHKDQSRTRALELYPEAPLSLKKHHNRADAILIARFGGTP